jgi:hypothetical protein
MGATSVVNASFSVCRVLLERLQAAGVLRRDPLDAEIELHQG